MQGHANEAVKTVGKRAIGELTGGELGRDGRGKHITFCPSAYPISRKM